MYTTGECIHLSLDSSFVVSGSTTDSNKIYLVVSCILHHSFFSQPISVLQNKHLEKTGENNRN